MTPGEVVMKLTRLGFHFRLEGEAVKVRFEGEQTPDPAAVSPLLELVRRHREDVHFFLRCHCPKCGGAVFGIFSGLSRCMACNSGLLAEASKSGNNVKINEGEVPQAPPRGKILRCGSRQLSLEADDPPF